MAFPAGFLDDLRDRVPLPELIGKRVNLTRKGREYAGLCPFHNEKTPSFFVVADKGFFHCQGCHRHGDAIGWLIQAERLDFLEAVERLAAIAGIEVPRQAPEDRERARQNKTLLEAYEEAAAFYERSLWEHDYQGGAAARRYLTERGLDEATIRRFRLGWAGEDRHALAKALREFPAALLVDGGLLHTSSSFSGPPFNLFGSRIIFPICDRLGRVIAFGGRTLGDAQPKYLNSPDHPLFDKGRTLYLLSAARGAVGREELAPGGPIVVEGYMDAIALQAAGFGGAVATLGTALTEAHLTELWRLDDEPAICFDGDAAGVRARERTIARALPAMKPGQTLRLVALPAGEDPDSLVRKGAGRQAFEDCLAAALPLSEALWQTAVGRAQLDTPERRAGFAHRVMTTLSEIPDATLRDEFRRFLRGKISSLAESGADGSGCAAGSLADPVEMIEAGKRDPLSAEAFGYFWRRHNRGGEGHNSRLGEYAYAALLQAEPDDMRQVPMPLGGARGIVSKTRGTWQPGEPKRDEWLETLPLFDRVGNALVVVDILAWYPGEPGKWWSRTGAVPVLSEHRLAAALAARKPVRVYRTPSVWNEAGGGGAAGCCILDWDSREGQECRAFARSLAGDDAEHCAALQKLIERHRPRLKHVVQGGKL